jgi:hypothetical protein
MAEQPHRRRVWPLLVVAGLTFTAVAAVALGGGHDPSPTSTGEEEGASPEGVVAPPPPVLAAATGPGPASSDGAVPVGFARSADGAAAAASSYLSTLHGLVLLDPVEREAAVRRMAAPSAESVVNRALESMEALDVILAEARAELPGARVLLREVPVAYDVEQFDPDRARVACWSLGIVLVEGRTQATEVWSTNTVELVWEQDDWRVWSWSRQVGPVPAVTPDEASDPAQLLSAIEGWEGFRYVPSS